MIWYSSHTVVFPNITRPTQDNTTEFVTAFHVEQVIYYNVDNKVQQV